MSCRHQQAEPVILFTGETVACVCIECLAGLDAGYIEQQWYTAWQRAHCEHGETAGIRSWGAAEAQEICTECGEQDPFLSELLDAVTASRDSAASVVPIVLRFDT